MIRKNILQIGFVVTIALFLTSCGCSKEQKTAVYVLVDQTDEYNFNLFKENYAKDVKKISDAYTYDQCASGLFRLSTINDLSESIQSDVKYPKDDDIIPSGKTTKYINDDLGLPESFEKDIEKAFSEVASSDVKFKEMRASRIYKPVCASLSELSKLNYEKKVLIIYSDMLENSDAFKFYDNMNDPDVEKTLSLMSGKCDCEFPNIKDIEIYVIAHHNRGNDKVLEKGKKFWKHVFADVNKCKEFVFKESLSL